MDKKTLSITIYRHMCVAGQTLVAILACVAFSALVAGDRAKATGLADQGEGEGGGGGSSGHGTLHRRSHAALGAP